MLFKVVRCRLDNLPTQYEDGCCYFIKDDGTIRIDYKDIDGVLKRTTINAEHAKSLQYKENNSTITINPKDLAKLTDIDAVKDYTDTKTTEVLDASKQYTNQETKKLLDITVAGLAEAQKYTNQETKKLLDISVAALAEAQKYTDQEIKELTDKQYAKNFVKSDFTQIGTKQRWYLQITKKEHGLTNPYVDQVIVHKKADGEETQNFYTKVICQNKVLTTETVKIYITIDLSKYTEYSGVIYLKGG